jgi:hypothetical protein
LQIVFRQHGQVQHGPTKDGQAVFPIDALNAIEHFSPALKKKYMAK